MYHLVYDHTDTAPFMQLYSNKDGTITRYSGWSTNRFLWDIAKEDDCIKQDLERDDVYEWIQRNNLIILLESKRPITSKSHPHLLDMPSVYPELFI